MLTASIVINALLVTRSDEEYVDTLQIIQPLPDSKVVKQIEPGHSHTMILTEGSILFGCGGNDDGRLGLGEIHTRRYTITAVPALPDGKVVNQIVPSTQPASQERAGRAGSSIPQLLSSASRRFMRPVSAPQV